MSRLGPALVLATLATPLLGQAVLVVDDDGGPGVDHTTIPAAIAAAAPGTIVLVRPGAYSGLVTVDAKSLVIEVEPGASFDPTTRVTVRDLGPGQQVALRGFTIDSTSTGVSEIVTLINNTGTVWIEDSTFVGSPTTFFTQALTMRVERCERVVLDGVTVVGGSPLFEPVPGGVHVLESKLFLFDTDLVGGEGLDVTEHGGLGGPGIELVDSFVFSTGSTIVGGQGGTAVSVFGSCPAQAGNGGFGAVLSGPDPRVFALNTVLAGGPGGDVEPGCASSPGMTGQPSLLFSGTIQEVTAPSRTSTVTSPVRTDELATVQAQGVPGELAFLLHSPVARPVFLPSLLGTLTTGQPLGVVFLGTLDGAGTVTRQLTPTLPPGVAGRTLFTQAFFHDPSSSTSALGGSTTAVVLLDAAF